ncbi:MULTISPECIES: TVP38/TMEM64 family protein [Bacillus]|uniref:TVP38/TMEM64 family protein n=1 Tax=Bacillus TaxID=1386 RepID=UPI0015827142|nr:TVP38/TMEM64 family protein [Bacillus glycinifermentans]MBU8787034.1 VTT domain-containing protein [Bacillus glycinifermentans]NUJ18072.1 TVP38/TMEM64 family protein [Bacillus glycinifermentans]
MPKKALAKWAAVLAIAAAGLWFNAKYFNLNPSHIREGVLSFGVFAPLMYIGLLMVRPFLLLPASVFAVGGGLAFGSVYGSLYSFIGAAGGAFLSFAVAYKLGGNMKNMPLKLDAFRAFLQKNGFFSILLLRLAPIHFDAVSYAAGVSKVKPLSYLAATAAGIIPGTVILNALGSSIMSGDLLAISVMAVIYLLFITVPLLFRKKVQELLD